MKIEIRTFYRENYGAFFQAFALRQLLVKSDHEVYHCSIKTNNSSINESVDRALRNCGFDIKDTHDAEIVICGSDEIFNLGNEDTKSNASLFFGVRYGYNRKIIIYGASATGCGYRQLIHYRKQIRMADYLSVRDTRTYNLLRPFLYKKPVIVSDPVLLINWDVFVRKPKNAPSGSFIFVYAYALGENEKDEICALRDQNIGCIVCSGGADVGDPDGVCFGGDPFEWLWYVKNSEIVFTGSYHGTLFSAIFHKKMRFCGNSFKCLCFLDEIIRVRKASYLRRYKPDVLRHMSDYYKAEMNDRYNGMCVIDWNKEHIQERLLDRKNRSIEFLQMALGDDERKH